MCSFNELNLLGSNEIRGFKVVKMKFAELPSGIEPKLQSVELLLFLSSII